MKKEDVDALITRLENATSREDSAICADAAKVLRLLSSVDGEAVAWRPKFECPSDFSLGPVPQETVDYWKDQGVDIEYAYLAPPSVQKLQEDLVAAEERTHYWHGECIVAQGEARKLRQQLAQPTGNVGDGLQALINACVETGRLSFECYDILNAALLSAPVVKAGEVAIVPRKVTREICDALSQTEGDPSYQSTWDDLIAAAEVSVPQQAGVAVPDDLVRRLVEYDDYGQFSDDFNYPLVLAIRKDVRDVINILRTNVPTGTDILEDNCGSIAGFGE